MLNGGIGEALREGLNNSLLERVIHCCVLLVPHTQVHLRTLKGLSETLISDLISLRSLKSESIVDIE